LTIYILVGREKFIFEFILAQAHHLAPGLLSQHGVRPTGQHLVPCPRAPPPHAHRRHLTGQSDRAACLLCDPPECPAIKTIAPVLSPFSPSPFLPLWPLKQSILPLLNPARELPRRCISGHASQYASLRIP
jgi:hypothetical protein